MIYEYLCDCGRRFEIWKPVDEFNSPETCSTCGAIATRLITGGSGFMGAAVEDAEYNPGLGCVTRNAAHRREIAKSKGLEEIGNESPDAIHSEMTTKLERAKKARWDEVDV